MIRFVALLAVAAVLAALALAQSASDGSAEGVGLLLLLIVAAILFFAPSIIASNRRSVAFGWIVLLNLLGGATGCLWFVALLWACFGAKKPPPAAQSVSASAFAAGVAKTPK